MSEHTVAAFDEELSELAVRVAQMGGLVEKALTEAVLALERGDEDLARRVIEPPTPMSMTWSAKSRSVRCG
jgi:phosphate transport system protein